MCIIITHHKAKRPRLYNRPCVEAACNSDHATLILARRLQARGPQIEGFQILDVPVLLTRIEGKGNGMKTVIPNMSDVAKALSRPPSCKHISPGDVIF